MLIKNLITHKKVFTGTVKKLPLSESLFASLPTKYKWYAEVCAIPICTEVI